MSEKIFQVIIIFFSVRASRQARRCPAAATAAAADRHAHRLFTRAPSTIARLLASCGVTPSRTSSTLFTHGRWGCSCPSWCVAFAAAAPGGSSEESLLRPGAVWDARRAVTERRQALGPPTQTPGGISATGGNGGGNGGGGGGLSPAEEIGAALLFVQWKPTSTRLGANNC